MPISITFKSTDIIGVEIYVYKEPNRSFYLFDMNPCRGKLNEKETSDKIY